MDLSRTSTKGKRIMASFQEVMRAAANADKAGDEAGAKKLVDFARSMMPKQQVGSVGPSNPEYSPVITPKVNDGFETKKEDRFGDTIAKATEAPKAAFNQSRKGVVDPNATGLERVGSALMTALNGAGLLYSYGAGTVGEVLGGSPTSERKLARDLMMMGEVAVPELSGVSATARMSGRAAKAATQLEKAPTSLQASARAADDLGITPSLGAGGKGRAMTAATLEKVPGTGGMIAKDAERFVGEVESVFSRVRNSVGTAEGAEGAGEALQSGLSTYVSAFRDKSSKLFDDVAKKIPQDMRVSLGNTSAAIADLKSAFESNPELANKLGLNQWDKIISEVEQKGINWQAVRQFRTEIGNALGEQKGSLADESRARLKRLYGALTEDMDVAANAAGSEAKSAWQRANRFYKRGAERIENDLDKTINADSPERAFEAFDRMTKKGSSTANAKRLYRIKSSMPAHEWNNVSASIIDRLGRATDGAQNAAGDVFSPTTFLTKWNKMTPEAKSVLLPPEARKEMTKLAQVAEAVKSANAERNFSNTGTFVAGTGVGLGLSTSIPATMAILGGAWASGRALTSPAILRAVNKAARGDTRQLNALARGNGPYAEDARTILTISAADAAQGGATANLDATPMSAAN